MRLDHIKCLKTFLDNRIAERDYAYYNTWGKDIQRLLGEDIAKAEGRRKVPLLPCRCGNKRPDKMYGKGYIAYQCQRCDQRAWGTTDRTARLEWNHKNQIPQKGGKQ